MREDLDRGKNRFLRLSAQEEYFAEDHNRWRAATDLSARGLPSLITPSLRIALSDRVNGQQTPYEALTMLRQRYQSTLIAFYTAKCTFDADNLTLIMNEPNIKGFIPPTHLIIMNDPTDESQTSYFPTHQDLWRVASGYSLPRRDPALPWNCLVPVRMTGNAHGPMSILHTLLYGIVLPPEQIRGFGDAARGIASHFKMPYIVADIDAIKSGHVFFEEDEDELEQ